MRANTFSFAPTITESVPSTAAWRVRATGASANWMPRAEKRAARSRAMLTGVVDRSTTRPPGLRCVSRLPAPRHTACTCGPPGNERNTMSACSATSRTDSAGATPAWSIWASASRSLSNARTSWPDLAARLRQIGAPITPRPMKPSITPPSVPPVRPPPRPPVPGRSPGSPRPRAAGGPASSASRDIAATAHASACRSPRGSPR